MVCDCDKGRTRHEWFLKGEGKEPFSFSTLRASHLAGQLLEAANGFAEAEPNHLPEMDDQLHQESLPTWHFERSLRFPEKIWESGSKAQVSMHVEACASHIYLKIPTCCWVPDILVKVKLVPDIFVKLKLVPDTLVKLRILGP